MADAGSLLHSSISAINPHNRPQSKVLRNRSLLRAIIRQITKVSAGRLTQPCRSHYHHIQNDCQHFPRWKYMKLRAIFYPSSHYHFRKNFPAKSSGSRIIIVIVIALENLAHALPWRPAHTRVAKWNQTQQTQLH